MPDAHVSEDVCVGTVTATRRRLLPAAVGGDIGCGMATLRFDGSPDLLADAAFAAQYASLSRRAMVEAAAGIVEQALAVRRDPLSFLECDHNHVRREEHGGELLWVHRKGAMRLGAGERGVVPGSMGSPSFHVEGRAAEGALCSSAHGAGRAMSRSEARRRISTRALVREAAGVWFDHRIADRLREEAPSAYKDIGAVMRAQRDLVKIERRVEPVLVYKAV